MNPEVRERIAGDLLLSTRWESDGRLDASWSALEGAHVLSQPWAVAHVRVHAAMLGLAWRRRDGREAVGQVLRLLLAGPGSITGRFPVGNSGRATVPMTEPMPISPDLAELLDA